MSNVQLVKDIYDAFGRGDMATVRGAFDPAIEWREAEGNPYMPSDSVNRRAATDAVWLTNRRPRHTARGKV